MSEDILSQPPPPADRRIAYGPHPSQFGDLFLPQRPGPHPVVIALHGGFWRVRYGLDYFGHAARALADQGFAVWSLEYRRLGEEGGGWPGTRDDVLAGAAHLARIAGDFKLDLDRVAVLGHSAGGHLAFCVARAQTVRGVVGLAAVSDLAEASRLRLSNGVTDEFLGGAPAADASPMHWNDLETQVILIHGTEDPDVPYALSRAYAERHGAELITLEGMGHFECVDPTSQAWPQVVAAIRRGVGA